MNKNPLQSKTVWGMAVFLLGSLYGYTTGDMPGMGMIQAAGISLAGIGFRSAMK